MKPNAFGKSFSASVIALAIAAGVAAAHGASLADLWQARNGAALLPSNPVEWVKGNAGPNNSHYLEGYSIPYRVVLSGVSTGHHQLVLEWDTTQHGKHAIDFLTGFNRLQPHNLFGNHTTPETIEPLAGVSGPFSGPLTVPFPTPSSAGSPVDGQPASSFAALPVVERLLTIWNGTISSLEYLRQDSPAADSGVSQIAIDFDATASTVVIAFGGHIATTVDWGVGNSATSIGGSPYHLRLISFDGGGGNQDRSVQAIAVVSPPTCVVTGPATVCTGTTNVYSITTDAGVGATYSWSLTNNTSGATIVGPADGLSLLVIPGSGGSFGLHAVVSVGGFSGTSTQTIQVNAATAATPLFDQVACLGSSVTFRTTPSGTGPFSFVWRMDTNVIGGATNPVLRLDAVSATDAGTYCVEVSGACGTVIRCGTLSVEPPPALICPLDFAVQCFADVPQPAPGSVLVSGGAGTPNVFHAGDTAVTNGCEILIRRTYRAIDSCGIEAVCQQTILIRDTTAPVITCAPGRTVECGAVWDFDAPSATDVCGTNVTITILGTVTNAQCGRTFTAIRTWQATDACGNNASCSQTVIVVDTTAPVITCAPGRTVECGAVWDFDAPSATDVCGPDVTITILGTVTNAQCGRTFTAIRTWQATDACGNNASCSQTVIVVDTTAPVITCAPGRTVECGAVWDFNAPSATDVCGTNVTITILGTVTNAQCGRTFTAIRTWQATDACGNNASCSQTVIVVDTTAPVITCAPGRTVECGAVWDFDAPSATDVCGTNVTITILGTVTNVQCGRTFTAIRTWQATDACGNNASCSQTVIVVDTTAPVITCAPGRTVECGAVWDFDAPTATDVCGPEVTITILGTVTNAQCGRTFTAIRTWQATDACGKNASCSQTVNVVDTTAPVITCAPGRTVECGAMWDFDAPTATDVCDTNVTIVVVSTTTNQLGGNLFRATRIWRTTDACGNTASCSQTMTVVDTTPPAILCPTNITVDCRDAAGAGVAFGASATDVCDGNPRVTCQPASGSIFAIGTTIVDCVAIDVSGNQSGCSFTVSVRDTEPPRIVCPAGFAVLETAGGSGSALVTYPNAAATDNCDTRPAVVCNPLSGSTLAVGIHLVTCTATDASGNQTTCTFTIQVVPRVIVANSTADSGPGTLRQAILDANAAPGSNVIQFAFPGNPPYTIQLLSPLPPLADVVTIDGWSQLQFTGSPVIQLNGTNLVVPFPGPGTNLNWGNVGLVITAGGTVVRGLTFNGFETGIRVEGPGGNVIQGNRIGTDVSCAMALPNTGDGILLVSPGNLIGGNSPQARNIISGNGGSGIRLAGGNASSNLIWGNYIGIACDGVSPLGNLVHGVRISGAAAGNVIGGRLPGEGNVIAFNGGSGVSLDPDAGSGNLIRGNAIHSNGGLGIDLGGDGITPNDNADSDQGPNGLQNTPVLSSVRSLGGITTVAGTLEGLPNTTYLVEFFLNSPADASGAGAGQMSLGTISVTTDASGESSFTASFPVPATALQSVVANATDAGNNTSEFSAASPVGTPPEILVQPVGVQGEIGSSAIFCVTAVGSQPLLYQWRLNGANVPGATNRCLTLPDVQLRNGGVYTVVIANDLGIARSEPARLSFVFGDGVVGDNFADRVPLLNASGIKSGNNAFATEEPGEPPHGGQPGGKSVWYTWTPPGTGIATFSTAGSDFDTLLGVYSGSDFIALLAEAGDEDSGGFYTSQRSFNVFDGFSYQIAIDGFGGASGNFLIAWTFEPTRALLPVITNQPVSRTVASGSNVTFTVGAFGTCREFDHDCRHVPAGGHPQHPDPQRVVSYQWFLGGVAIPGATSATLTLSNVQPNALGTYYAEVTDDTRTVRSDSIGLQINETGRFVQNVQARDKFLSASQSEPLRLGGVVGESDSGFQPAAVVRGYTGTQVFNSAGAGTEAGEESICGVLGGASEWVFFLAEESGFAYFNTDGSSYDTVMAVFTRATNSSALVPLSCDNNGGLDGHDSSIVVPVQGGRTNYIVIDGLNGATGVLRLNYSLVTAALLVPMETTPEGNSHVRVSGRQNVRFTLQRSPNLKDWSSLLTTNSASGVFDFIDTGSAGMSGRFYRALLLP